MIEAKLRRVIALGANGSARLWDVADPALWQEVRGSRQPGEGAQAHHLAFHPDGQRVVSAESHLAVVWSVTDWRPLHVLRGHPLLNDLAAEDHPAP